MAKLVNAMPQNGSARVGLAFTEVSASDRERLEFLIVDAVLKQLGHLENGRPRHAPVGVYSPPRCLRPRPMAVLLPSFSTWTGPW
jgi:hypothetical protein